MARNVCIVDGCDRPVKVKSRGWCGVHYSRWTRHGDPLVVEVATGRPASGRYPMRDLTCRDCGQAFRARHGRRCRACRRIAEYVPCECGTPRHPNAEHCRSCAAKLMRGDANPKWAGGRFVGTNGYAMVRVDGHPRYAGSYVPEHTLVMEETLGRHLLDGESVHHRNGVRDDNRPENLELWVKSQPAGQRAADLLAWARKIEATYGPLATVIAPDG